MGEAVFHFLLRDERLDDAQAAQGLVQLGHRFTEFDLGFRGLPFEIFSKHADAPGDQGYDQYGEQGHFPTDENQGPEVEDNEDGILDEHIQAGGNRRFHDADIAAHPRDDVPLLFLGEKAERKAEHFVVNLHPQVTDDTGTQRNHHGGGTEIAGALQCRHQAQEQSQIEQGAGGAEVLNHHAHIIIEVFGEFVLDAGVGAVPGDEVVMQFVDAENHLQDGDDEGKRKNVENRGEYVQTDGPEKAAQIRADQPFHQFQKIFHKPKRYDKIQR